MQIKNLSSQNNIYEPIKILSDFVKTREAWRDLIDDKEEREKKKEICNQ